LNIGPFVRVSSEGRIAGNVSPKRYKVLTYLIGPWEPGKYGCELLIPFTFALPCFALFRVQLVTHDAGTCVTRKPEAKPEAWVSPGRGVAHSALDQTFSTSRSFLISTLHTSISMSSIAEAGDFPIGGLFSVDKTTT
jgi:hypothetical protein